jgi:predicted short-subunit dehydrogenase-like oxidoreductase (DUF2520 family)
MTRPPLGGLRFTLVGPGRVGGSVARWLLARGATLTRVARRGSRPLPRWASAAGARGTSIEELASAPDDLLLLAVPDPALPGVVDALATRSQAAVALHTSGPLGPEALAPLRRGGSRVGGLHPLRAFPRPLPSPAVARRTFFALAGDPEALALGGRIAVALGAPHAEVPAALRPLYHLAATWAAGGTVTLLGAAVGLHAAAGVDAAAAGGLHELARGALSVVDPHRPAAALTGPLARGEGSYLTQLERLRRAAPELHPLAVLLALEGLRQLAATTPPSPAQEALRSALREICGQPGFLDPLRTWV